MSFTQDLYSSRRNYNDGTTRIGELDRIWYDPNTNTLRIGNNQPGGRIINGGVFNSQSITSNNYQVQQSDYYLGVNYPGAVTITLPNLATGTEIIIKDESGNCSIYNITVLGNIDNDPSGVILAIDNGAIHMIYHNGWRII